MAALDLHEHEALAEHSDGSVRRVALGPDRPVGEVTRELLRAIGELGGAVEIDPTPQEAHWEVPLDEDDEHRTYDQAQVETYFAAATQAALALAEFRAPYRGRSTPVNAWWGSFDLAVSLFSGQPADPPSDDFIMRNSMDAQEVAVGWWPGDPRYGSAAFYAYVHPARPEFESGRSRRPRRTGTPTWACSSSTGTTSARAPIPTRPRSSSSVRHSGTGAACASGIRLSAPARRAARRRSAEPDRRG